ncbi:hypothetical protein pb186bvf_020060 [Paramecium bursaria]
MIKIDKLSRIQKCIQNIKADQSPNVIKTYVRKKPTLSSDKIYTQSSEPIILNRLFSQADLVTDDLQPIMNKFKTILDKYQKPIPKPKKLDFQISAAKQKQIFGTRRIQIQERLKEISQTPKYNKNISFGGQEFQREARIITEEAYLAPITNRLNQYQERLGLLKGRKFSQKGFK